LTTKVQRKLAPAIDPKLVKAIAHPMRLDALRIFNERVASPKEVAGELGVAVTHLSYHVKVLRDSGWIELVRTNQVRGATQHFYRATSQALFDDEVSRNLPQSARENITVTMVRAIIDEVAASMREGTFDEREDRHVSWMPVPVDTQGWDELTALLAETLGSIERIKADSAARRKESGDQGFTALVALLGFEAAPGRR
jgi:DNA-binding transcriptional ArsR family regulator